MLKCENIKKAFGVDIAVSDDMANAILLWSKMYVNRAPWLVDEVKSLNLPATVCSEFARMVLMEMEVSITGGARAEYLKEQFARTRPQLEKRFEYQLATGGMVLKPYIVGKDIAVDYVSAENFFPVSFDTSGKINSAIFPTYKRDGKKLYTKLEWQEYKDNKLTIVNKAFLSTDAVVKIGDIINLGYEIPLSQVEEWADIEPIGVFTYADSPLFSYSKVALANNIDPDSPLGVSVYARAAGAIKDTDEQYSATLWEYKAKEVAIQASKDYFDHDRYGRAKLPKGKERTYYEMGDAQDNSGKPLFNVYSPEIRDESFFRGYNRMLQRVEFASGLASGTISDLQVVDRTATEIIYNRQRTYSTVQTLQNSLREAIQDTVHIMDVWADLEGLAPVGNYEINVDFDDSLLMDSKTEREQDLKDVAMGLMQPWEYRVKHYKETVDTAKQMIPDTPQHDLDDLT